MTATCYGAELTVGQARSKAKRLRGQVADGGDPAAARAMERAIPALAGLAERYLIEHAAVKKKPASCEADRRNLDKHISPALGRLRVDAVTRADVARLHAGMRATPVQANRCLALLSKMFTLSEAWGLRPDGSNPTRHIEKYPERKAERFLSNAELGRRDGEQVWRSGAAALGHKTGIHLTLSKNIGANCRPSRPPRPKHLSFKSLMLDGRIRSLSARRPAMTPPVVASKLLTSILRDLEHLAGRA